MSMKRFNLNQFLWVLLLMGIFIIISYGLLSGTIYKLFTRKTVLLMYPSLVVLLIVILIEASKIFSIPDRDGIKYRNIIFLMALIFMSFGILPLKSKQVITKPIKLVVESEGEEHDHNHKEKIDKKDVIKINDDNYFEYLSEMQGDLDNYLGKKISIEGTIVKAEGKYIVVKNVMTCCKADEEAYGMVLECNPIDKLYNNDNYYIEGIISKESIMYDDDNIQIPIINVIEIKKVDLK